METIAELEQAMLAAAERNDFAAAAALRNQLLVLRHTDGEGKGDADYAGLKRQQPGARSQLFDAVAIVLSEAGTAAAPQSNSR